MSMSHSFPGGGGGVEWKISLVPVSPDIPVISTWRPSLKSSFFHFSLYSLEKGAGFRKKASGSCACEND